MSDKQFQDENHVTVEDYFNQLIEDANSAPGNYIVSVNISAIVEAVRRIAELETGIKNALDENAATAILKKRIEELKIENSELRDAIGDRMAIDEEEE